MDLHIRRLKYYVVPCNKAAYHKVTQRVKACNASDSKGKISGKKDPTTICYVCIPERQQPPNRGRALLCCMS